jgi:hypothetical protein
MKKYSPAQWAALPPETIAALAATSRYAPLSAEDRAAGLVRPIDLGWMCSCFLSSSSYPGVPSDVSFSRHKCGPAAYTNFWFAVFLAAVAIALVVSVRFG